MALFGKKPAEPQPMPQGLPVDQVMTMRSQGMNNNQIVQALQRDGFDTTQVFDALNQADMQATGAPLPGPPMDQGMPPQGMPMDQTMPPDMGPPQYGPQGEDRERIEELAETIIDEKWDELIKNINKIAEWKDSTETRLAKIEQRMVDLKDNYDKLHKAIIGKISEYDQNIINVGTEVKAMERVFQKLLPTFTENVNELSRITKNVKKK